MAANPAACRLLDRTEDEIKKIGRNGVVDPSDPRLAPAIEARRRTGTFKGELNFRRKDGTKISCEVSSSVFKDKNGNERTSMIVRDITERQRVVAALRESEERYHRITEAVTDYIYTVHVADGHATETTHGPGCLAVTGYETHEFTNDHFLWYHMVLKEDRPLVEKQARRILAGEDPPPIEHRITHKNGSIHWVRNTFVPHRDMHGTLTAYDGLIQDITARKQAEKAVAALALRNQTLLQTASDGIHVLDEQGNVVEANSAFCNLLGYTREETLQLNVSDWDRRWSREELLVRIGELIKHPAVFETRHRRKDGTLREVEINGIGVSLEGQNYLYASARDITGRKQAEANKEKLAAQNQQLQKAESLGRMAGAIAHHFNNQLQSVMLRLELAINDLPRHIEPVESLTEAMISARKAAEMSTLMLTYLGQTSDKSEPLDLAEVCTRSLAQLRVVMPQNVTLQTDLPSPGPNIYANSPQIQQVLLNLVTNAWEACGDELCSIRLVVKTVSAAGISSVNRFPLDWQPADTTYACLEITDAGGGIEAQDVEKLFDPFFSSKFTGRGLGLPVVLGIVRVYHGAVTVDSQPGQGSIFRVFLPISEKAIKQQP